MVCLFKYIAIQCICNHAFNVEDFEDFRELMVEEIKSTTSGISYGHPLGSILDGLHPTDQPLIPSLIRLIFHD